MKKSHLAWVALAVGMLLSLAAANIVRLELVADEGQKLAHAADQIKLKIRERLESHELILRGGAGLFSASAGVSRADWKSYVDTVRLEDIVPGVQGIGFSQIIRKDDLKTHIANIRSEGFSDYTVSPAGERDTYSSIIYLEPFRDRNLRAFGYDMFSEPVRHAAMALARDTGKATLSGKVELVQESGQATQAGTLMYVAVYRRNMPHGTPEQRKAALIGWAYSPFRMNDLMGNALQEWKGQLGTDLQLSLYDGAAFKAEAVLYSTGPKLLAHTDHPLHQHRIIDFNGHQWLMALDRNTSLANIDYTQAWLTLAAGVVISGLLFWLLNSLIHTNRNAERIAEQLTRDIVSKDQQLRESEYRWKFALEGSDLGVWDWNIENNTVFLSKRWKEMLGFSEHEIGNRLDEWSKRIHPDDLRHATDMVQAYLDGKQPEYDSEHRIQCKDGGYKWIRDRGMVVHRDAKGRPLRMIGTHSDITERKRAEQALASSRNLLRSVVENAPIRIFWKDLELRYLGCNKLFAHDAGLSHPDDLLGKDDSQLSWHAQAGQYRADDLQVMRSGIAKLGYEEPQTTAGGRTIWLRTSKVPLRDDSGNVFGILGAYEDITEQKKSENDIRRLTNLYAALSECNAAVIHCTNERELFKRFCEVVVDLGGVSMAWVGIIDASGRIVPVASHGSGLEYLTDINVTTDASEPHGNGPTGTATRENRAIWVDDFRTSAFTTAWQRRASPYGWLSSAALPICRGGKPVGALTFYSRETGGWYSEQTRDLVGKMVLAISYALDKFAATEEAQSSQATLIESEQRFRTIVEQSIAGTFIIQNHHFAYANPRLAEILGYSTFQELIGMSIWDIVAGKDRAAMERLIRSFYDGDGRSTTLAFTAQRRDGPTVEVGISLAKAKYLNSTATIGLMQDISDKKVAEEQIRRYSKQLENSFMQMVTLATTLSEMRDAYTAGHEKRVAGIAVAIGGEMGLPDRLEGLRVGGHLHDVGKVAIPSEILAKPGRLSPIEFELIKMHSQSGYDVLKNIEFPWPVAQMALQHHERLDGSGYPRGLKGEEIIIEARIIAVADVVESMASHRPYRAALGIDSALAEIERGAGSIYDPEVVKACLRLFREKQYALPA